MSASTEPSGSSTDDAVDEPVERVPAGVLLTASELEGMAPTAEWSRWIERGRAPGSNDGAGFRLSWRDDLSQLASLGANEIAVTLEWARLWPTPDAPDQREVEFRRDLLTAIAELDAAPWACLVDGSLPGWFADDERGFTDDKARGLLWPRHVDWVGETFGDLVAGWIPMREPRQWAAWGRLVAATPPGFQRRRDMMTMVDAVTTAELEAERLLRGSSPVATFVTSRAVRGERDNVKAAPHARWLDQHLSAQWTHELSEGRADEAFDRVVVQLRPGISVDGEGAWSAMSGGADAEVMLEALEPQLAAFGGRTIVAAGDLAGRPVDGSARHDHLAALVEGSRELGANGWWQTSPIDGWHWQHGFDARPGLLDRDRNLRTAPAWPD